MKWPQKSCFKPDFWLIFWVNWDYLKSIKSSFFLAGGIGIENISNALKISSKVDISSNLEEIEGKKSVKKIEEFLLKVEKIDEQN